MENTRQNEPRDYFLIIPASVARRWFNPAVLYGEILSLSQNGPCVASDAFFAERYNIDQRTVRNALKNLETAGLIERKRSGSTGREIIIKDESMTGKNLPNIRQELAGHAEKSCRSDGKNFPATRKESSGQTEKDFRSNGKNIPVMRKNFSELTGKNLPNSNISLVNSLSRPSKQAFPTDQEIFDYAEQIGLNPDAAERFIQQMEESGWQIDGKPVRSWKGLLRSRLQWQTENENGGLSKNEPKPERLIGIHL